MFNDQQKAEGKGKPSKHSPEEIKIKFHHHLVTDTELSTIKDKISEDDLRRFVAEALDDFCADHAYDVMPNDRIVIIRSTTLEMCDSEEDVVREVGITVAHEIAHHFGISDDRLEELGLGDAE